MNIDFMGKRGVAFLFSLSIIFLGLVGMGLRGGLNFGIDFTGGLLLHLSFDKKISLEALERMRGLLGKEGIKGNIQGIGASHNEILIKTRETGFKEERIRAALGNEFGKFEVLRAERIGPAIGKDMQRRAILAIIFALAGILIYITLRFELRFAIAAILALFHDILITILGLSIFGVELDIPVIAALLTISGYSINDTIVIFDRIRENVKLLRKETYPNIINLSINQTLGRTIITSLTTLFAVAALYIFGGPVLHAFSITLLIGIFIGTYSSIFVAAPFLIYPSPHRA